MTVVGHESNSDFSTDMLEKAADLIAAIAYFRSKNAADQWLAENFQNSWITRTAYSIRPLHCHQVNEIQIGIQIINGWHLKPRINQRENNNDLNGSFILKMFSVSQFVET
jgi:hypothetical protein